MNVVLTLVFLGTMQVTSYRSVPNQTDESPYITSIGEYVHPGGVAVSRDLLSRYGGPLHYGDHIFIEGYGIMRINDTMNARHKKAADIWVSTYAEEKAIGVQKRRIYVIRTEKNHGN